MLRPDDFDQIKAEYETDRVMAASAAETRNALRELAQLGAAFAQALADLPAAGRELIDLSPDDADGTARDLFDLAASADAEANTLTKGIGKGGRRSVAQARGDLPPRYKLLLATRDALAAEMGCPRQCEVLCAASEVLSACDESARGLEEVYRRLPHHYGKIW